MVSDISSTRSLQRQIDSYLAAMNTRLEAGEDPSALIPDIIAAETDLSRAQALKGLAINQEGVGMSVYSDGNSKLSSVLVQVAKA